MKKTIVTCMLALCAVCMSAAVQVVAHRGYWDAPGASQNSIRSLVKADSIHCEGSEFDVWITTDGQLFVNHDPSLNGVEIQKSTAAQVRNLRLKNGEKIPTLEQYLKAGKKLKTQFVCELKPHDSRSQEALAAEKIVKMVKKYGLEKHVTYITFSLEGMKDLIRLAPAGTEVYYLNGELSPRQLKELGAAGLDYHYSVMRKHPEWYKESHDLGLKVNVWTVNTGDVMQECIDMGADFITTNAPELLQRLVALDGVVPPCSNKIAYIGRINRTDALSYLFVYPGTSIKAAFTGTGIDAHMKPGSGYFEVIVDGLNPHKIYVDDNDSTVTLASGLGEGLHEVEMVLVYEGYAARPEFRGFTVHDGQLENAPALPELKLEFIGNSITCGYGNEAPDKSYPFADSTENHYFTYAALTARALNAQEVAVARSGIGVYRNYAGKDKPNTMTKWYDYTCILDSTQRWDFKQYRPDIICVNLGTNDLSTKGYDINTYEEYYLAFIRHLHEVQPQAKIVALTGSMLAGTPLKEQKVVLDHVGEIVKAEGVDYYHFDMSTQDGSLGYGASWHPSMKQHEKMAGELIPFLRSIIGK